MPLRAFSVALLAAIAVAVFAPAAGAQPSCGHAIVFTLPGITWDDIHRVRPPNLLEVADRAAIGSMAVRTNSARTTYASGFVTIGAGSRMDGGGSSGGVATAGAEQGPLSLGVRAAGVDEIEELAEEAGYDARAGALADALQGTSPVFALGNSDPGLKPPSPLGHARWALLAAMNSSGFVGAATHERILVEDPDAPFGVRTSPEAMHDALDAALAGDCSTLIVDPGDLTRADQIATLDGAPAPAEQETALLAADDLLGYLLGKIHLSTDLLLIVSPTSPGWDEETHLGVAIAAGPGFDSGATLRSASTRADELVTLPDVAPTIVEFFGVKRPDEMLGRPFVDTSWSDPRAAIGERVRSMVELNEEAVYSHGIQADIATGFVVFQVLIYILIIVLLWRTERKSLADRRLGTRWLELGALAVVAFPLASYLATPIDAHEVGLALLVPIMVAIDIALVAAISVVVRPPLARLFGLTAATLLVMVVDLVLGGPLQFMAIFGNDPINAGRFAGLGNIAFAILGTCSLITASILVHRWPQSRGVLLTVIAIFVVTVVADGAPQLGSDVGGVLALVPALVVTFLLLTGRRASWKVVMVSALGAVVALAIFLAVDLSRPVDAQTHLGRFFEDVRARGPGVFFDTIERKARTNLRIFTSTIWTYLVPPALLLIIYLVLRPRGRWQRLALAYPRLRAGLIGGLVLAVLGFAVNDSGIVVPAMVLSFLVPMALLVHLALERESSDEATA